MYGYVAEGFYWVLSRNGADLLLILEVGFTMFSYVREMTTIWTIYKIALNELGMIGVDLILLLEGRAHNVFIC